MTTFLVYAFLLSTSKLLPKLFNYLYRILGLYASSIISRLAIYGFVFFILFCLFHKEYKTLNSKGLNLNIFNIIYFTIWGFSLSLLECCIAQTVLYSMYGIPETTRIYLSEEFIIRLFIGGIFVSFIEHYCFKGIILNKLNKVMPIIPAVIFTAILEGVYQGKVYTFIISFLFGILFNIAYERHKTYWASALTYISFVFFNIMFSCIYNINLYIFAFCLLFSIILSLLFGIKIFKNVNLKPFIHIHRN